ncbi:MAG: ABC transporter ATP-binding protein [Acidimicrobiaceae bacterium]|nr:ABC transporter ATP-binding protein [Acidimicrobiaceae bacterium]
MTPAISLTGLTRRYQDQLALDGLTVEIKGPTIMGLLGRNGAGKTTLLRILDAQELPSSGTVEVLGANPIENDAILQRIVLVREDQQFPDFKVLHALRAASWFYAHWSQSLAETLLREFDLPTNRRIKHLSRGMRTALGIVIGLATRAEVTLFDEPYAGLDAVARQLFYDRLLAEYTEHPRTFLLSTHLVDEAAALLERAVMIDHGRIIIDAVADDVRGAATMVRGPGTVVEAFVAGRPIWDRRRIASQTAVVIGDTLEPADRARAGELRLDVEPLSLQQVMVHAAGLANEEFAERMRA